MKALQNSGTVSKLCYLNTPICLLIKSKNAGFVTFTAADQQWATKCFGFRLNISLSLVVLDLGINKKKFQHLTNQFVSLVNLLRNCSLDVLHSH